MGIYLVHLLFTTSVSLCMRRLGIIDQGGAQTLLVAGAAFLLSWLAVSAFGRIRLVSLKPGFGR